MNILPPSCKSEGQFYRVEEEKTGSTLTALAADALSPQTPENCQLAKREAAGLKKMLLRLVSTLVDESIDLEVVKNRLDSIICLFYSFEDYTEILDWETFLSGFNALTSDFERLLFVLFAHSKLNVTENEYQSFLELFGIDDCMNGELDKIFVKVNHYIDFHSSNYVKIYLSDDELKHFVVDVRTLCRMALYLFDQAIWIKKCYQGQVFDDECFQHMCELIPLVTIWGNNPWLNLAENFKKKPTTIYSSLIVSYCCEDDDTSALQYLRLANQMLITKCLERIKEDRTLLQRGERSLELSAYFLASSHEVYNYCYNVIKGIPLSERSLCDVLKDEARQIFLLGAGVEERLSTREIKYRKQLADCGYDMMDNLKECLSRIRVSSSKNWLRDIGNEIQEFIRWADDYPHLAADICSDISLALSKLESDSFFGPIKAGLQARLIVHAFLGRLGEEKKHSFDPSSRYMHYLAIRDFCAYLPQIISFVNSLGDISGLTLFDLLSNAVFKTAGNFFKTRAQQRIVHQIPYNWSLEAISIINILRGDSFYELLQSNAEMQVIKFAGMFRKAVLSPGRFWNYAKLEFFKWWRPQKKSRGTEQILRIFCHTGAPLISAAATAFLFYAAAYSVIMLSLGSLTVSYAFYRISRYLIDRYYQVDSSLEACKEFSVDQLKKNPEALQSLRTKIGHFIDNSRRTYALVQAETVTINPFVHNWFNSRDSDIQGLVDDLHDQLEQQDNNEIKQVIHNFNEALQPDKLRKQLKEEYFELFEGAKADISLEREYLVHHLIKRLEQQWLIPKITSCFTECYADHFSGSKRQRSLDPELRHQLEDSASLIQKDRWTNSEIKTLVKKLALYRPDLRRGAMLSGTSEDMIDHIFPRLA
jgi:hypothetical protein